MSEKTYTGGIMTEFDYETSNNKGIIDILFGKYEPNEKTHLKSIQNSVTNSVIPRKASAQSGVLESQQISELERERIHTKLKALNFELNHNLRISKLKSLNSGKRAQEEL